jgi:NAD(P)-dependent dehydrogenase (short-subunit alcohol dehydrogenase family)
MFTDETLSDKTILVTGGGSGLGLAMSKGFARTGANVAICGRTEEKLQKAVKEIQEENESIDVRYYVCDVREHTAVTKMVDSIVYDFGSMEGLVNNAAGNFLSLSEDLSPGGFKAIVDIVLHGSFNCTHAFGNYLIDNKREGSILNIVTTYAENTGSGFVLPSACSKAGVLAMTKSLAFEWAEYGIRVNAIAPGPFPTKGAWSRLVPDKMIEKIFIKKIPMRRYGKHEELANLAIFLMSDLAPYLTGESVVIDGGERLYAGQFNFINDLMSRKKLKAAFKAMKPGK